MGIRSPLDPGPVAWLDSSPTSDMPHRRVHDSVRQEAPSDYCCGPCLAGNHDACMAQQPCDCPGCDNA